MDVTSCGLRGLPLRDPAKPPGPASFLHPPQNPLRTKGVPTLLASLRRLESNADRFLQLLGGKTMLIVGDSLASNLYSALAWSMPRASIGVRKGNGTGLVETFRDTAAR